MDPNTVVPTTIAAANRFLPTYLPRHNARFAVRPAEQEWKRTLNKLIMENQAEINKLLISYNSLDELDGILSHIQ